MENCANYSLLFDYYIDAEEYWEIDAGLGDLVNNREPLRKLLTALGTNTRVKTLHIRIALLAEAEVALFASSLEKNTSLDSLHLKAYFFDEPSLQEKHAFYKILMALSTRTKSLRTFLLYTDFNMEPAKDILMEVIRNNPDLKRMCFKITIGDGMVKVLEQIGESCRGLKFIDIDSEVGPNVLYALAAIVGKSRTIKHVEFYSPLDNDWGPHMDRVEELIGTENKALTYCNISGGGDVKVVEENKQNKPGKSNERMTKNYHDGLAQEEWMKNLYSQEANFDLTNFSLDLMFAILVYTGDFDTIRAFFQTNKHWHGAAKEYNFWKHMANSFLPIIDPDVLAHTDAFYAKNLVSYGADKANFWELLVQHSFHYCGYSAWKDYFGLKNMDKFSQRLPFPHPAPSPYLHDQLLVAVSRRWPSLSRQVELILINKKKHSYHKVDLPYCWIQISFGFSNLYHIILQTFANKRISGFFFVCDNTQSFFNDPFQYIQVPLEYFTAHSVDEALIKMQHMMDTYAGALGRKYEYIVRKGELLETMCKAKDTHKHLRREISHDIDRIAANIMERLNVTARDVGKIADLVEKTTKRLREQPIVYHNELIDRKQKFPDRYNLHLQYPRELLHDISFYEHNRSGNWGKPTKIPLQQTKQKKKSNTTSIKATLSKLTRIIMNFVVMPVLKTLWPRSSAEVDRGYIGTTEKKFDDTIVSYYMNCYQPFSNVTITDSYPHCWPISAVVIAKHVLVKLGQLVEYLVSVALKRGNNNEYSVDKFIDALCHYDLIPQKHLNGLKVVVEDLVREI
jgi:hypothetical protein